MSLTDTLYTSLCVLPRALRSIDGNSARDDLRGFMKEREISYIYFDVGVNQEPFLIMRTSVVSAVVRAAIGILVSRNIFLCHISFLLHNYCYDS